MNLSSITVADAEGCLVGTVAFALVLLTPGYVAGWATDLLDFRRRPLVKRMVWSVPLSFGFMTIVAVMVGKYLSLTAACWLAAGLALLAVGLVAMETLRRPALAQQRPGTGRTGWLIVAGILLWSLFVVGELIDVGLGSKLYMSVTVNDHALRSAFVDAVVRTGVPPKNPLYWVESGGVDHAAPMRYYYFWYVLGAMVVKLAGISARQAMVASCVWSGFGLVAIIALYCRHFVGGGRRRTFVTIALLAVTGLDILPTILIFLAGLSPTGDMEWWSEGQVASWLDTMLWVPHHLAGLVCCLSGFLLIWMSADAGRRQQVLCGLIAGAAFASSLGLSTYVAAAFAIVMAVWMVWVVAWDRFGRQIGDQKNRRRVTVLLIAGVTAMALVMPYVQELRQDSPGGEEKTHVFALGVRPMINANLLANVPGLRQLRARSTTVEEGAAHLLLVLPGYAIELGFFGFVLLIVLVRASQGELGESERTAVFLTVAGLVVATFVKSTVIGANDFGMRSMLIPQFFLLLLSAMLLDGGIRAPRSDARVALAVFLSIGVAGTIYQAVLLRTYLAIEDRHGKMHLAGLAERTMALRQAFSRIEGKIPADEVVQYNTHQPSDYFDYAALINLNRQTVNALPEWNAAFGGDPKFRAGTAAGIARLYEEAAKGDETSMTTVRNPEARELCSRLGIDDLVATRWDHVWQEPDGWVWRLPVVIETANVRVMDCRTGLR